MNIVLTFDARINGGAEIIIREAVSGRILGAAEVNTLEDLARLVAGAEIAAGEPALVNVNGFSHAFSTAMRKNGIRDASWLAIVPTEGVEGQLTILTGGRGASVPMLHEAMRPLAQRMEAIDKARQDGAAWPPAAPLEGVPNA